MFFFHYLIGSIVIFAVALAIYEWRKKRKIVVDLVPGERKQFTEADAELIRAEGRSRFH